MPITSPAMTAISSPAIIPAERPSSVELPFSCSAETPLKLLKIMSSLKIAMKIDLKLNDKKLISNEL